MQWTTIITLQVVNPITQLLKQNRIAMQKPHEILSKHPTCKPENRVTKHAAEYSILLLPGNTPHTPS